MKGTRPACFCPRKKSPLDREHERNATDVALNLAIEMKLARLRPLRAPSPRPWAISWSMSMRWSLREMPGSSRSTIPRIRPSMRSRSNCHFFRACLKTSPLSPLLVGAASPEQVAGVIETVLGKRTLLVVSTDLSHYLDYATAKRRDLATARTIERLDYTTLGPNDACGFSAVNGALCAASRCGWTVTRLDLRNSGDTSGEKRRVVGYGAWAFMAVEGQEHD